MAAGQQLQFRGAKIKSKVTGTKGGKETHYWLNMRPTVYDYDRLGELIYTDQSMFMLTIGYKPDQHVVEKDRRSNRKFKKDSKEVEKVIYAFGNKETLSARDFVRDFGLIKCLAHMNETPNPFYFIPALDGFEIPLEMIPDSYSGGSVNTKSKETWELKAKACNTSMVQKEPCAGTKFKTTEKRLRTTDELLKGIKESDSGKKAKSTEEFNSREKPKTTKKSDAKLESKAADVPDSSNNAKTTEESDSGKKAKTTEYSESNIKSKVTDGSESRKKAKAAEKSDHRKRAKVREKSSAKHELKATEREIWSGKELMMDESEEGKETDNQEEKASSRPVSKIIRTCMNCALQEPAPKVFKKCRRCKDEGYPDPPYYCGRDCQVLDWTARHRQQHEKNAGDLASS